ncbi:NADH-ubiquinone oxidoreductase [Mesotoga sp. Brook.08.YT.4.2.5.1]|uniref:proton-conducting transporter transmembrane domain-containing protein n=1 Tax=unclassified Mesotoga TaxID=1184398 RepID=UPI000C9C31FD|nr:MULTISPECIES: proton-conducting transporter membrane subunit [unclassified Mesotoga]PNE23665.1 NADH-ubiquinone oxidoreductase [Mesotoga sp. Brook.08.YT.4.2.5.1]RAO97222.1 NADH-ubiquinone oxidoreductase [Mesotoga sp. Brook.08.YT.4.2.5.4.]RDI91530.1 NADH-ubiquinone oxidoreductase [Mesotoga sp. Brook.08.YT.4.2.5.2.]
MIALVFLPVLGGIVCLVLKDRKSVSPTVAIVTTFASGSVLPFVIFEDASIILGKWGSLGIGMAVDEFAIPFLLSTFIVMLAVILNSIKRGYDGFFYALILILYGTLNSIFLSRDLFSIFVTIELASIISFILISYEKKPRQAWASLKYLLLSSLGLNFYLLGIGIVYMETGSFAMDSLEQVSTIATVLIFGGLAVKSGLFFFSMWLPDAHSNAPIEVSPILSGLIVKLDVYLSIRFITYSSFGWMRDTYMIIGIVSAIVGVIFAVNSKNAKRVLAYHTISQVGFMLVNCDKSSAWHGFSHAIFKTLLFLVVGNISARLGTKEYSKWSGKITKVEYAFLLIGSLAIAGFPMTSGCVTKEIIIHGACCPSLKILLLIASAGTAMSFSKFIFLKPGKSSSWPAANTVAAYSILSGVIIIHGIIGFEIYMFESLLTVIAGMAGYLLLRKFLRPLPVYFERIDSALSSYLILFLISIVLAIILSS